MILSTLLAVIYSVVDVYKFTASVQVPRVYDNSESLGYRKNQTQTIKGEMAIIYDADSSLESGWARPRVEFLWLTNQTHKINKKKIGYSCTVNNDGYMTGGPMTRVNAIGNNKKDTFTTPDIAFYLDAEPDYSIGEDDEDNSLLVSLSGTGSMATVSVYGYKEVWHGSGKKAYSTKKKVLLYKYKRIKSLNGKIVGTLGCGCRAYGHKSPTRVMGPYGATCAVDDVAKIQGTWKATFDQRVIVEEDDMICDCLGPEGDPFYDGYASMKIYKSFKDGKFYLMCDGERFDMVLRPNDGVYCSPNDGDFYMARPPSCCVEVRWFPKIGKTKAGPC